MCGPEFLRFRKSKLTLSQSTEHIVDAAFRRGGELKKLLLAIVLMAVMSVALAQDAPEPSMEITGIDPTGLPTVRVMVNVFDDVGQPVPDLTVDDFEVTGELADRARVVEVTSFSDENIPISVVLAVDTSSSMTGTPIRFAQVAAGLFVTNIGPQDPVALVAFSSGSRLVQDFTTDRDTLVQAIENLNVGGETYLFDGALAAVEKAAETDNRRRAVILLSDGAQYDTFGLSRATSEDVENAAVVNGIPIYTIGLGYGADRHFLEGLSANTNALFRESPTPDELVQIYDELANLLRTQYEVVLEVDVPADGTTYDLTLEVDTRFGTAQASGRLRAPVPVPVVRIPEFDTPVETLTEVTADVIADDGVVSVEIAVDGETSVTLEQEPYAFIIDPVALAPGSHDLRFTATDTDGDIGTAAVAFDVAALPSDVIIVPDIGGEITDIQSYTLEVSGQTPVESVEFSLDGGDPLALVEPYNFTIDPFTLAPGGHSATIEVTNTGGATATLERSFSVPELPVQFAIEGLEAGQVLEDSVTVSVNVAASQAPVTDITFAVDGEPVEADGNTLTLNAVDLPPGDTTLSVVVANEAGQETTASINFQVAALAPEVTVSGLEAGETLEADREVTVDVTSQTPLLRLNFNVDGQEIESEDNNALLDVLALGPGTHTLTVTAANEAQRQTDVEIEFAIDEGPSLTATAQVPPTEADTPTGEPTAEESPTATVDSLPTVLARANELAATAGVRATGEAAAQQAATADAAVEPTETEDVSAEATGTAEPEATATLTSEDQRATLNAISTAAIASLQERITQTAESQAQVVDTGATETAAQQATADAQATADLVATANALATVTAEAEETSVAAEAAQATSDSASTATAAAVITAQAEADEATSTAESAALVAQATSDAGATITAEAESEAATATAVAEEEMQATTDAEVTNTAEAQEAQAQADEAATLTVEAETADDEPTEEVTGEDDLTPTEAGTTVAQAGETLEATEVEDASPAPTVTPAGTLIPAQAETTPSDQPLVPLAIIGIVILIVLLLIFILLGRSRRERP